MKPSESTTSSCPDPVPMSLGRLIAHCIFGVFLPAFTLDFEIVTGFSDEIYINPIPTLFHAIVIGIVPVILATNLFRCVRGQFVRPRSGRRTCGATH